MVNLICQQLIPTKAWVLLVMVKIRCFMPKWSSTFLMTHNIPTVSLARLVLCGCIGCLNLNVSVQKCMITAALIERTYHGFIKDQLKSDHFRTKRQFKQVVFCQFGTIYNYK